MGAKLATRVGAMSDMKGNDARGAKPRLPQRVSGYGTAPGLAWAGRRHGARFGSTPDQVAAARRWVHAMSGLPKREAFVLELVVSELVTNALRHTRSGQDGEITMRILHLDGGRIRISVTDEGPRLGEAPTFPEIEPGLPFDDHGRGLFLVNQASRRMGVLGVLGGPLTVWAVIERPSSKG